jgi:iron complex outermembrane receptor protein
VTYFPTSTTEVSLGAGILDAVYDDYDEGNGITYDGENIQETPEYTVNLGLGYYHPGGFYTRTDIRCQGKTSYLDDVNKEFSEADAYFVWDMKIGYRFNNMDIYVYGKNLADEAYITSFKANASIGSVTKFGDPRTLGMGVRYHF